MIPVIIPVRNGGETLRACLEAVFSSDIPEGECEVVVDEASRTTGPSWRLIATVYTASPRDTAVRQRLRSVPRRRWTTAAQTAIRAKAVASMSRWPRRCHARRWKSGRGVGFGGRRPAGGVAFLTAARGRSSIKRVVRPWRVPRPRRPR